MNRFSALGCMVLLGCSSPTTADPKVESWQRECPDLQTRAACEARSTARVDATVVSAQAGPRSVEGRGSWAVLRPPTRTEMGTPMGRIHYWGLVGDAHPGEPATVAAQAAALLPQLRAKVAENADLPLSQVTVKLGETSVSVKFQSGAVGTSAGGRPVGFCAPGMFGPVLLGEMRTTLLAANIRALMCISDHCDGAYNLRPESAGTLVLNGDACPGIDILRADLEPE